tara:strand:- start:44 stop:448 length:405 start_codon:yes stop_codon:yes gene_type:complete
MKPKKMLAGGLLKEGIKIVLRDPGSKKGLKVFRKTLKAEGLPKSEVNKGVAMGIKHYLKAIENKIKSGKSSPSPVLNMAGLKIMGSAKKAIDAYITKQNKKVDLTKAAIKEGRKATKHFKGGLMVKPKLAQKGY